MIVKVCGMRDADNIREIESLGVDMMGFIFWPKSSRCVSEHPGYLPERCRRVGVFVDESMERVERIAREYALDYVQLHGRESAEYIRNLKVDCGIIKALNIATTDDLKKAEEYSGFVGALLFDTKGKSVGGNGEKFDWSVLDAYDGETPFLLSGGIGPDDAERVRTFSHPKCIGIDLNSRFETEPGLKNVEVLRNFLKQIYNEQD
ncbi:MAG: phosphoribosylanthranilate isomerase [Prevotella sp.]|nr:phosphoribosylanthranilate isomerase [Prevotella sp.]